MAGHEMITYLLFNKMIPFGAALMIFFNQRHHDGSFFQSKTRLCERILVGRQYQRFRIPLWLVKRSIVTLPVELVLHFYGLFIPSMSVI
jgi:hypothetical protein